MQKEEEHDEKEKEEEHDEKKKTKKKKKKKRKSKRKEHARSEEYQLSMRENVINSYNLFNTRHALCRRKFFKWEKSRLCQKL